MLQNAYLDAKFRFDTDENEPKKECCSARGAQLPVLSGLVDCVHVNQVDTPEVAAGSFCTVLSLRSAIAL